MRLTARLAGVVLLGLLFAAGKAGFHWSSRDVKSCCNQVVLAQDGVPVCFDVFEPETGGASPKNAVILGHGVMVTKEIMRLLALELARAGFVAVALDFRGHGRSGGNLTAVARRIDVDALRRHEFKDPSILDDLAQDIGAIESYLAKRGDIDMANLGYVGYSLGAGVGYARLSRSGNFRAMVGVTPLVHTEGAGATMLPNLLLIAAKYDEVIPEESLWKTLANKTGVSRDLLAAGRKYGEFEDKTAAKLYVDDDVEHLLAPLDLDFARETRDWMLGAFGKAPQGACVHGRLVWCLIAQTIGAVGMVLLLLGPAVARWGKNAKRQIIAEDVFRAHSLGKLLFKSFGFVALLSFPAMLALTPLFLTPHPVAALETMLVFGPSLALLYSLENLLGAHGSGIRRLYRNALAATGAGNLFLALLLGFTLYAALFLTCGQFFGIVPARHKWPWVPLYFTVTAYALFNFGLFLHAVVQERIGKTHWRMAAKTAAVHYCLQMAIMTFIVLVLCAITRNYFAVMFLICMVFVLFITTFSAIIIYAGSGDVILCAIAQSVFLSLMFCTMSPPISLLALL